MSTGILALLILLTIVFQFVVFTLIGIKRKAKLEVSETEGKADSVTDLDKADMDMLDHAHSWEGYKAFIVTRRVMENTDQSICSFYLSPVDKLVLPAFLPGQYLTFKLSIPDSETKEPKDVIRCYSLSDSPNGEQYRITVKRTLPPNDKPHLRPGVSSNFFHDHIFEGDQLMVKAPAGHFYLSSGESLPVVLISGGIGITPMLSMLFTLLETQSVRDIWFFYGVRNSDEHILKKQLRFLAEDIDNLHLHVCYSRPLDIDRQGVDYHHEGRVDIPLLRSTLNLVRHQFYVCGPPNMMESMVSGLEAWGVDSNDIFYESFGPATLRRQKTMVSEPVAPMDDGFTVSFSQSEKQAKWEHDTPSLLALAESQGIDVPSGCRAGSCGSCQTMLRGKVEYDQQPDADIKSGHCLLCISRPRSDVTLSI